MRPTVLGSGRHRSEGREAGRRAGVQTIGPGSLGRRWAAEVREVLSGPAQWGCIRRGQEGCADWRDAQPRTRHAMSGLCRIGPCSARRWRRSPLNARGRRGIPACSLTALLARADHVDPVTGRAAGLPSRLERSWSWTRPGWLGPGRSPACSSTPTKRTVRCCSSGTPPSCPNSRPAVGSGTCPAPAARPAELDGN